MKVLEVRHAELIRSLTEQAAEHGITDGAIVALIGAVDDFAVSTPPAEDPNSHNISRYPLPAEMAGTGEFIGGKPHIHAVMAVAGDRAIAGHLIKAQLGASFARAFVIPTEEPITLLPDEGVVIKEFPDAGPSGRPRINDTRPPQA
jgi:hypothetical protein